jgi:phosphoglycolate phosphatase
MFPLTSELVIFDLDGTLIDSLGDLADSLNLVLEGYGYATHPRDSYRHFVGDGIEMLVRRALPPEIVDEIDIPGVVSKMRQEYSTRWTATTRPFPGIPELLIELHSRRIQTAVLSNKPDTPTRRIVGELFDDIVFEIVRGALEGVPLKPDPTAALDIVSELGVGAGRSIFIGDTRIDVATGRNAGMRTVGVTWGYRDAHELVEAGADHVIGTPLEMLNLLD